MLFSRFKVVFCAESKKVPKQIRYKKYFIITKTSSTVFRVFAGAGLPLANRKALPFDRSFFAGGSNGIRAWRARALGPGNVADTSRYGIDQVGEIQLEMNLEYRFKIVKQFEGAAFVDLGNIWFWNDENSTEANFDVTDFWEKRMESILAYSSQFYNPRNNEPETAISSKEFLDNQAGRGLQMGRYINAKYGEGFVSERPIGIELITDLL